MTNQLGEKGQSLAISLVILTAVVVATMAVISGSFTFKQDSKYTGEKLSSVHLAEAGIDKAVASLNSSAGSYNGESETTLGNGSYQVTVTSIDANTKLVESTGYIPNKATARTKETVSIQIAKGDGISFNYGIQIGDGGFKMEGGSTINGSVYSNSDIELSGGARITGTAQVAGGTQPTADQQTDCTPPNCLDYIFGKTVSGENRQDVAQSFQPSTTAVINKVSLKLKKVGAPSGNPTIRIMENTGTSPNNKPDKSKIKTSGTLNASLVTTSYGFVDVTFATAPSLTANTTYWIMIHSNSLDNSNYWVWSEDSLQSYNRGVPKWSSNWQAGNPTWTAINGDLGFKTYMGGIATRISGTGSSYIDGDAHANTLIGDNPSALMIGQHAYYQTQSTISAHGQNCDGNNSYCHAGSIDPVPMPMPISDSNIDEWKDQADDQIQNGNLTIQWPCTTVLEKKKYVGNVTVQGGCTVQADSPVWITGNLTVQGGSTIKLKSSYGTSSGVIVIDGTAALTGGSKLQGSGTAGSYLMVLSTYNSPTTPAIDVSGGNSSSIVYAANGFIKLQGGTNLREVTAKRIELGSGATVTYESGVANPFFTSGPSGSFSAVKGTYQSK